MTEYITRKKTLMGIKYEIDVALPQYGGAIIRVHALPDMVLARIEDRMGYTLEDAIATLSSQNLTEKEMMPLKENDVPPELIAKVARAISPKLKLFLGELCKVGIVPDPECICKGRGCAECDVALMVEEFKGYTIMTVGMAIIGASTADWKSVQDFFLAQKAQSGAALPA